MKHIAQSLTLGLAVLAASAASPKAADWAVGSGGVIKDFGSIKDYQNAAVPVPAPRPAYSEGTAEWYLRGDIGWNVFTSVDATATESSGITTRTGDDLGGFAFGSIGAGRYITPSLRGELSFDFRPKKAVTTGPQYFYATVRQPGPPTPNSYTSTDVITVKATQTDDSGTRDQTAFVNLFYDFNGYGRFTPYVGAGIGLDFRSYKRTMVQNAVCDSAYNIGDFNVATPYQPGSCPTPLARVSGYSAAHYVTDIGVAAAFMVGASYKISNGISVDSGYRMIWEGATISASGTNLTGPSTIKISERLDHELHTGLRFDLN